ncbi:MAG: arginase family protein [Pseudolysinimonas sp.]|uniref:arginase family protein n=1 Tax=Pseudolysinimonas sp. TaxID=2680009 RepID=UPI0032662CDE
MTLHFVLVPQWQGSPSPRAMRHAEGVAALRSGLPTSATTEVAVPLEAGDDQGSGIARFTSIQLVRERTTDALGGVPDPFVIVGGDCGVSAAGIATAALRHPEVAVVWFDAHPDLNTPQSSPSGAYSGMVLRSLIDGGEVSAGRVVLVGARSWDPDEESFAAGAGLATLAVEQVLDPDTLVETVAASGADSVYVHVDLDVVDPAEVDGLLDPAPFGMSVGALVGAIKALRARFPLAGATLAGYAPSSAKGEHAAADAATILRIIAALD